MQSILEASLLRPVDADDDGTGRVDANLDRLSALGEECLCYGERGDYRRDEVMYWREIWLERVNS